MLEAGDLLVIRTNGSRDLVGRTAVVQDGIVASFASYLIRFQFDRSLADPHWIDLVMNDPIVRRAIESLAASSAGQFNLSLAKLNALAVPVPAPADQAAILREMRHLASARTRLATSLAQARLRAEQLRRAALTAAFSGRLTGAVSDSDRIEELATAL
jgi:type I restriction enzyme S subunit